MLSSDQILDDGDFEVSFRSRSNSRASNLSSSYYSAYPHSYENGDTIIPPASPLPRQHSNHVTDSCLSDSTVQPSRLKSRDISTLISLCCSSICSALFYSLLAPFFPTEAQQKGASNFEVGLIMGSFQLIIFFMSPIYGHFLTQIGPKFMYVTGIIGTSICAILFGTLSWCPDGSIYVIMCFLVRGVEAVASAGVSTSNLALAAYTFPSRLSAVMGLLEACSSIGLMIGPPLGGALFSAGGFGLPFFVSGGVYLLCGLLSAQILPSFKAQKKVKSRHGRCSLLSIPIILLVGYLVAIGSACIGFTDVGLAGHIQQFNLSPAIVGLLFLIPSGSVIIFAPINGWLTDKNKKFGRAILIIGCLIGTAGFVCLGPSPLVTFFVPEHELWVVCTALAVSGIGLSCLVVTYQEYVTGARNHGFPDTMETQGLVSGVYNSFTSLGAFIGPTVGGVLLEKYQFSWSSSIFGAGILLAGIMLIIYSICEACCCPSPDTKEMMSYPEEQRPLLQEDDTPVFINSRRISIRRYPSSSDDNAGSVRSQRKVVRSYTSLSADENNIINVHSFRASRTGSVRSTRSIRNSWRENRRE